MSTYIDGLVTRIEGANYSIGRILQRGYYCIQVGFGHSIAPLNFQQAWSYLNGVDRGVEYMKGQTP